MATTTGTQGCSAHSVPDASKFNEVAPAAIDTDQWCQAIASFGGKYATIVAKHVCGFAIWDTHVSMRMRMRMRMAFGVWRMSISMRMRMRTAVHV